MAYAPVDIFTQQARNRRRSRWLVVGFVAFFAWLGFGGDYIYSLYTANAPDEAYHHVVPFGGIALTLLGTGLAAYAWKTGPQKVLWSAGAREIVTPDGLVESQLVNVVEEMAIASGIRKPRVWIIPDADPNAFATGHDERDAHVAVTEGLLLILDREELQAVIAHEMGHVKNLDVRLMTILASLAGAVALISDGLGRGMMRGGGSTSRGVSGGGGSRSKSDSKGGGGPLVLILLAVWIVSWLLAPLVIRLLALGVSRSREFLADDMSAQFTRNPLSLASALEKIDHSVAPTKSIKQGSAHLCIADPLGRAANSRRGAGLFATHPPMTDRVSRLQAMGYTTEA